MADGKISSSPSAKKFDSALARLTTEVTIAATIEDHTKVRFQNAALHSLETLSVMQHVIEETLKSCGPTDRTELLETFGGDCRRVAMKRARVEQLQTVLAVSHHTNDRRPARSLDLCQSVEDVLRSVNLGQALVAAQQQARSRIQTAATAEFMGAMAEAAAEDDKEEGEAEAQPEVPADQDLMRGGDVSPIPDHPKLVLRKNTEERAVAFKDLDEAGSYVEARAIVEGLFEVLDTDGTGVLEGEEAEQAIDDLVMHVMRESADRAEKYGGRKFVPTEDAVRKWVWDVVDTDKDGKITAAEAVKGFMAVVDDIDDPEEKVQSIVQGKRASIVQ